MMKNNNEVNPKVSLKTQFWLFKKHRANSVILLFFLAAGVYGLYQGFVFKSKQVNTIENFRGEKEKDLTLLVQGFDADTTTSVGKEDYKKVTRYLSASWNIVLPAFKTPSSTSLFWVFAFLHLLPNQQFFANSFFSSSMARNRSEIDFFSKVFLTSS